MCVCGYMSRRCEGGRERSFREVKLTWRGTSLVVQWLRICLTMQGMKVQSLVQELRSHMTQNN